MEVYMQSYHIAFIPGDGVGTEVSEEAVKILVPQQISTALS
jgi:isocitrate/isopropylmalate dehydrogenase